MYNAEFKGIDNSTREIGWEMKNSEGHMATCFPGELSEKELQAQLALVLTNKTHDKYNRYLGTMSDGKSVLMYIKNGIVETAFPYNL